MQEFRNHPSLKCTVIILILFAYFLPYEGKTQPRESNRCCWTDQSTDTVKNAPNPSVGKIISIWQTYSLNVSINVFLGNVSKFSTQASVSKTHVSSILFTGKTKHSSVNFSKQIVYVKIYIEIKMITQQPAVLSSSKKNVISTEICRSQTLETLSSKFSSKVKQQPSGLKKQRTLFPNRLHIH